MDDRLVDLLKRFELRARVFQTGPLCHTAHFSGDEGLGHIHLLRSGTLTVASPAHPPLVLDEPILFFYMNPTSHQLQPEDDAVDMVCAAFEFGTGMHNPLARALPDVLVIRLHDMPALQTILDLLFREASEVHCGRQAILDRLMEVVIIQLLRDLMDQHRLNFGLLAGLADPRLSKAINAMHADPACPWSLQALATAAGMSRARFAARFRDCVGMTPLAYLAEWRLGVAESLLMKGKSVQYAAEEVGYGSASALSRAFTAQLGQSPTAWLKKRQA